MKNKPNKTIVLPSPFKEDPDKDLKEIFVGKIKVSKLIENCGENGIDWKKYYLGDQTEDESGIHFNRYDEHRVYNSMKEEERKSVESEITDWLHANLPYEHYEIRISMLDDNGQELSVVETGLFPRLLFSRYKVMCSTCANGADSFWVAHSSSWPKLISSKRIYSLTDNRNKFERHNFLKRFEDDKTEDMDLKIEV